MKVSPVSPIVPIVLSWIPQLVTYFTKTPVNAVTGAAGGSLITLVLLGMNTAGYDQLITYLQNNGEYGLIAASAMAALRMGVMVYTASKGK